MKKYDVVLTVDDYREAVPSCAETFQKLLVKFRQASQFKLHRVLGRNEMEGKYTFCRPYA